MTASRLSLALSAGALALPAEGRIGVFRARADTDLDALPRDRVHVVQGFRPDHDALAARGYAVAPVAEPPYALAIVMLPRAKAEARALIAAASAAAAGGPVLVDGAKTDGVESLLRECRARVPLEGSLAKAHGKAFWFRGGDFADWAAPERQTIAGGFVTAPGVFSADGIDRGSALLADALPARMPGVLGDLGAGWGYLSRRALERPEVTRLHLVEAEHAALDCARRNVTDPRAVFHWADVARFSAPETLDAIVTNPPFHTGRAAEPDIGRAFIARSADMLKPSGRLWCVANRHLPYEATANAHFAQVREIGGDAAFKIIEAAKPRRGRR